MTARQKRYFMKATKKFLHTFSINVTRSFFKTFLKEENRGPNFTWIWFKEKGLPSFIEMQLWLNIGNNKNWKAHLPLVLDVAQQELLTLFKENNINV